MLSKEICKNCRNTVLMHNIEDVYINGKLVLTGLSLWGTVMNSDNQDDDEMWNDGWIYCVNCMYEKTDKIPKECLYKLEHTVMEQKK